MVFWGQACVEGWKKRELDLQLRWGTREFNETHDFRPDFKGKYNNLCARLPLFVSKN
jgi:hypothetical protein